MMEIIITMIIITIIIITMTTMTCYNELYGIVSSTSVSHL